jgi:hypothetical protein
VEQRRQERITAERSKRREMNVKDETIKGRLGRERRNRRQNKEQELDKRKVCKENLLEGCGC